MTNGSGLRAALDSTNGTVTSFLEQLVDERIDAEAHHHLIVAPASNDLDVEAGEPLLERAATLHGRRSGSPYVYAESVIATNRLPGRFCDRLQSSVDPIGRILDEMGIAVTRQHVVDPDGSTGPRANGAISVGDYLLSRTYQVESGHTPLMVITEWFLATLRPFLPSA